MKLKAAVTQGFFAGPAVGAWIGLADCLRAAAEGRNPRVRALAIVLGVGIGAARIE